MACNVANGFCVELGRNGIYAKHRGQSSSHSGKRRTKGVATSFGFRRRPASSSRAHDNRRDNNGNTGSTEDLFSGTDVLSGRSTPLARPRKQTTGQAQRTNRFGFRQPSLSKTAKVGDMGLSAERAFGATDKDEESKMNNNAFDKHAITKPSSTTAPRTSPTGAPGFGKGVMSRQTVIVTYAAQQRPARSSSAGRPDEAVRTQAANLPRPLYAAVRQLDCKSAKQVANNSRKISSSNDGSSREGSATDSGVSTGGEYSPHAQRRRPRNLEMVMKGAHNFHLRELHVQDLDIMDEAVVTEVAVIPLPKLPSSFDIPDKPLDPPEPSFDTTDYYASLNDTIIQLPLQNQRSQMSTLERYRTNRVRDRPNRINMAYNLDSKDEEKLVLDRAQPEKKVDKQKSFIKADLEATDLPSLTRESSKESSPSTRSEESPAASAWGHHTAGESMANRSQDDVSFVLSISSSEEKTVDVAPPAAMPEYAPAPHPMLMKSLTLSQHDALRNIMLSSMTSSAYSGASGLGSDIHSQTLTLHDSPFDMTALETSTQSLIDDETSPADSLISSSTDSNNDMNNLDREPLSMTSSAYQTANTKTKSSLEKEDNYNKDCMLDDLPKDEMHERFIQNKELTPLTPGTPSNASNSLSLSDGRDYFDDEIADQPALIFQKSGENNDDSPSIRRNGEDLSSAQHSKKLKDKLSSPASQCHYKAKQGIAERTPSLDTLSSIASDDLMMDVDLGHSITSLHSVDEYVERLDGSLRSGLASLDESQLRQELTTNKFCAVRQWNQLLEQNNALDRQLAAMGHFKQLNNHSNSTSNSSLANIGASLPVRTARLLSRSRAHTPDDAPAALLQDVVDIKTMLLQLKRVLQEPEEEHYSKRSETLDPLLANDSNGLLFLRLADSPQPASVDREQYADLKRQILFLQAQVEERDRAVRVLQQQMSRLAENTPAATDQLCNAATQTDRLRPPMITSNNSTTENSAGLVSWNEQVAGRKLSWLTGETHPMANVRLKKPALPTGALSVKCQCGAKILLNGQPSADAAPNGATEARRADTSVQLKPNSRVGSRYLQAVSSRDSSEPKHYVKRDGSVNDRVLKTRSLNGNARSKSIENFNNRLSTNGADHAKDHKLDGGEIESPVRSEDVEALLVKHHTSYGDLFNGRINGKDSKCSSLYSNGYTFSSSGQLTDTDDNSDGGYKSLPPSINGSAGKRASGIPRRSVESKLSPSKYNIKASAV